jgi:HEAT repeat protein
VVLVALPFAPWGYYAILGLLRGDHFYHGLSSSYWCAAVRASAEGSTSTAPYSWPVLVRWWQYLGLDGYPAVLKGDPEAVPVLIDMLQSRDVRICLRALQALHGPQAKPAVPAVLEVLRPRLRGMRPGETTEESEAVRGNALHAIEKIGPEALPYLLTALADPDPRMRKEMCRVLPRVCRQPDDGDQVADALTEALKDPDCFVRIEAADNLYRIRPDSAKQAVPILIQALKDPSCAWQAGPLLKAIDREAARKAGVE